MTDRHPDRPAADDERETFTQWLSELRAAVAESVNGSVLRGARAVQVGTRPGSTRRPATTAGTLVGFSLSGGGTGPAGANIVRIFDGADENAPLLIAVQLPAPDNVGANGTVTEWFGPGGIHFGDAGLFITDDVGDPFEGSVFLGGVE